MFFYKTEELFDVIFSELGLYTSYFVLNKSRAVETVKGDGRQFFERFNLVFAVALSRKWCN